MTAERGSWLSEQIVASANRLLASAPSLLSPTGRLLQEDAATWVAQFNGVAPQLPDVPQQSPELKVVHRSAKAKAAKQLPLLSELPPS